MREGEIIAFRAKEIRPIRHGDRPLDDGEELVIWLGKPEDHRVRTFRPLTPAELVELRPGETIVTEAMRAKIEQFTGSLWTAETRRAVEEILLILDGKGGQ